MFSSETGWGIGCDATNSQAVLQILRIKQREAYDEMVLLLENPGLLDRFVREVPEIAWDLVEVSTRPLTIIFDGIKNIAAELIDREGPVGIRITKDDFLIKLLQRFRRPVLFMPVVSDSRNSVESFYEVPPEIVKVAEYVVEFSKNKVNPAVRPDIIKLWPGGRVEIISN